MKQGRFSNEQIVWILRETDQDSVVVAKRHGVSDATIYIWRKKFGQLDSNEVKDSSCWRQRMPGRRKYWLTE